MILFFDNMLWQFITSTRRLFLRDTLGFFTLGDEQWIGGPIVGALLFILLLYD